MKIGIYDIEATDVRVSIHAIYILGDDVHLPKPER
jgi:hypothetical protein